MISNSEFLNNTSNIKNKAHTFLMTHLPIESEVDGLLVVNVQGLNFMDVPRTK
jgi:hypothetical protein